MLKINKAHRVCGKTLVFRDANLNDASFILDLRNDTKKSQFLSPVSADVIQQEKWLERYQQSIDQAYFIIEFQAEPVGAVRLYDQRDESFCWGSWVLKNDLPKHVAIESALMVYAYAINHLGFKSAHFDVRKGNERVWNFHERFGAVRVGETDLDYLYQINLPAIKCAQNRYLKFLPNGVEVEF